MIIFHCWLLFWVSVAYKKINNSDEGGIVSDFSENDLKLARVGDGDVLRWLAGLASVRFNLLHDIHAFDDSSEDNMTVVQPGCLNSGDKELRTVSVRSSVCH